MSGYVPNPDDATQPTDPIIAETAAAEFRALKAKVNAIVAGNVTGFGIRNIIINGVFEVSQEFGTTLVTPAVVGASYVADQWKLGTSVASLLSFQIVATPVLSGYRFFSETKVVIQRNAPPATESYGLYQPLEGFRLGHLQYGSAAAKVTTLLFWAQASQIGNYNVTIRNALPASGPTRSYVATFNIPTINVWRRYAIVIPGDVLVSATNWPPNDTAFNASVEFDLGSSTTFETATPNQWIAGNFVRSAGAARLLANAPGNYLRIGGVEWKDGTWTVGSSPEMIPFEVTLLMCQRYFNAFLIAVQAAPAMSWFTFPTPMRAVPTAVTGGGAGFTLTSLDNHVVAFQQTVTASQGIKVDARLVG